MKPRLVVLSDLHGNEKEEWIKFYLEPLRTTFNCVYYSVLDLANIQKNRNITTEKHAEMVNGGMDNAVLKLLHLEPKKCFVLAFSIGGTIAWKAALKGMPILTLTAVSSTRLRKEIQKPTCAIELYFGEHDLNRPMDEWFEAMEVYPTILRGHEHDVYKNSKVAEKICEEIRAGLVNLGF